MRPLNFLEGEPWDEVKDDMRVRWFGHRSGPTTSWRRLVLACRGGGHTADPRQWSLAAPRLIVR